MGVLEVIGLLVAAAVGFVILRGVVFLLALSAGYGWCKGTMKAANEAIDTGEL